MASFFENFGNSIIGAGGDLLGSITSGLFNQNSADKQMAFQKHMANTQYQRAARDLEKAGLNRIIALGQPADAPSGASAQMPEARIGTSWLAGQTAKATIDQQKALTNLYNEQADKTRVDKALAYTDLDNKSIQNVILDLQREWQDLQNKNFQPAQNSARASEQSTRDLQAAQRDESKSRTNKSKQDFDIDETEAEIERQKTKLIKSASDSPMGSTAVGAGGFIASALVPLVSELIKRRFFPKRYVFKSDQFKRKSNPSSAKP